MRFFIVMMFCPLGNSYCQRSTYAANAAIGAAHRLLCPNGAANHVNKKLPRKARENLLL